MNEVELAKSTGSRCEVAARYSISSRRHNDTQRPEGLSPPFDVNVWLNSSYVIARRDKTEYSLARQIENEDSEDWVRTWPRPQDPCRMHGLE